MSDSTKSAEPSVPPITSPAEQTANIEALKHALADAEAQASKLEAPVVDVPSEPTAAAESVASDAAGSIETGSTSAMPGIRAEALGNVHQAETPAATPVKEIGSSEPGYVAPPATAEDSSPEEYLNRMHSLIDSIENELPAVKTWMARECRTILEHLGAKKPS